MNTVVDTLIQNGNELGNFQQFSSTLNTTIWAAKDTFDTLDELCDEAKGKIEEINVALKLLDKHDTEIHDEYFPMFNSARSKLRQVRNKLRKLAGKTVTKTRNMKNLFVALENNKKDELVFLGAALKEMKSLMISSEKILKEAYDEYNLAIEGFEKLNKKIQIQNNHLSKFRNSSSEEYKTWETNTRITVYTAINSSSIGVFATGVFDTADAFECLGICSTLGNLIVLGATEATVESKIFKYMAELRKFEKLTGNMLEKGNQIENTLREANAFLNSEIELIVEQVSENIDYYYYYYY